MSQDRTMRCLGLKTTKFFAYLNDVKIILKNMDIIDRKRRPMYNKLRSDCRYLLAKLLSWI